MREALVALAPAKINLGLEVVGRRADGMHEIVTIMQAISLYDRFRLIPGQSPFAYHSPAGIEASTDLVRRALHMNDQWCSWHGDLYLDKHIPEAAGLGGGSSDAATALNLLFQDPHGDAAIQAAKSLGADVPFFLAGGTALATATGTALQQLPTPRAWVVLVTPQILIPSKTRKLYGTLEAHDFTDGSTVTAIADSLSQSPLHLAHVPNAFARTLNEFAEVRRAHSALVQAGAPWTSVSGAGPTVFTLVDRYADASAIARRIPNGTGVVTLARTVPARSRHDSLQQMSRALRHRIDLR